MSHTTTAVVGRRCDPASASWKVAWWPRPVSGSLSARSRSEPSSSAVRRHAAPWVASCSSSSTSSVSMTAGSGEASTRAPSSSPCTKSPTATSVSTPAARRSARLAAAGASGDPTVKHEFPSCTQVRIDSSPAARRIGASGPDANDGRRPPAPVVRASSAEPSGTRSSAAFSSAPATASASCMAARSATWRSRRWVADSVGRPPRPSMRSPRAPAHSRRCSRSLSRSGSRDSTSSTPTVSPPASSGKQASATTPGLASRYSALALTSGTTTSVAVRYVRPMMPAVPGRPSRACQ